MQSRQHKSGFGLLWLTGIAGCLAGLLVGIGEFTLQFNAEGGFEDGYDFFARVSLDNLTYGHFFSTLFAPLYVAGYWHIGQMFIRGGSVWQGWVITVLGSYAFVVGNAWLGGRIYLALTAHEIAATTDPEMLERLQALQAQFGWHNEPLVNALRLAMVVVSLLWIWRVGGGKTLYPRWLAFFSPAVLLAGVFVVYFTLPSVGIYLLPAAMNVVHFIVFTFSLLALRWASSTQNHG